MTQDGLMPETPEAPETEGVRTEDALPDEAADTIDPEATAHADPDTETLAHADDADDEVLAGRADAGPLEGAEDGRLLD